MLSASNIGANSKENIMVRFNIKAYRANIMKISLFGLFLLLSEVVYSQIPKPRMDKKDQLITYVETFHSELNKEQLYINSKTWMFVHTDSKDDILEIKTSEKYRVIGKKTVAVKLRESSKINLSIQIDCKDKKFRYIIKILDPEPETYKLSDSKYWETVSNKMYYLLNSIKESVDFEEEFTRAFS